MSKPHRHLSTATDHLVQEASNEAAKQLRVQKAAEAAPIYNRVIKVNQIMADLKGARDYEIEFDIPLDDKSVQQRVAEVDPQYLPDLLKHEILKGYPVLKSYIDERVNPPTKVPDPLIEQVNPKALGK